jgi:hypothetical protein
MAPRPRAPRRAEHATPRHLRQDHARLQREHARAPRHLQALAHALGEVGVAQTVGEAVQGRLQAVRTRRGQIVGRMVPPLGGGRPPPARSRVREGDPPRPSRSLGALPTPT